jgi:NADPH:quinone reductase
LIINGAGGVGTLATQLAVKYLKVGNVITTASRPETIEWCKKNGAHHVMNPHKDLKTQLKNLGVTEIDYAFVCHGDETTIEQMVQLVKPFGHIVSIVPLENPIPLHSGFAKAIRFSWTFMFTKSMFGVEMDSQGTILKVVGQLFEKGVLSPLSTLKEQFGSIERFRTLHDELEAGRFHGKVVLSFSPSGSD